MLRVHICEDNKEQQQRLKSYIEKIIVVDTLDMEIGVVTDNSEKMLDEISKEKEIGIFFLDIDLQCERNGMELAKKIREIQPRCFIVFVTTHSEMSYMTFTYKVEAMDFIIKDDLREIKNRVHQCLIQAAELNEGEFEKGKKGYCIKQGEKIREVSHDSILYFEAVTGSRKIVLYTKNEIIEFNGKLKDIENELGNKFYRCHRSVIVNKDNIERIDKEEYIIYLLGGACCPMSVRLAKGIVK